MHSHRPFIFSYIFSCILSFLYLISLFSYLFLSSLSVTRYTSSKRIISKASSIAVQSHLRAFHPIGKSPYYALILSIERTERPE